MPKKMSKKRVATLVAAAGLVAGAVVAGRKVLPAVGRVIGNALAYEPEG
jgi:phosphate/sulfate permease